MSSSRARDVAKLETRAALIEAGLAEFAERGLDTPSLDAICARAGFTRGAFYVHFRDREDFLVAVMERVLGTFLDAIIATGDSAHDLELTVTRFAEVVTTDAPMPPLPGGVPLHRLLDACARSATIRQRLVSLLTQAAARVAAAATAGQAASAVRHDVDADQLGMLLVTAALGVMTAVEIGLPLDTSALRTVALRLIGDRIDAGGT
jgi:TetR/AcrR family transcriptional regulator, transcriptional repressor for nem operon